MPAMSRKTYSAVAEAIAAAKIGDTYDPELTDPVEMDGEQYGRFAACEELAERMADIFAADNPRFDRTRFRAATERN
jgi:hypothetical protein